MITLCDWYIAQDPILPDQKCQVRDVFATTPNQSAPCWRGRNGTPLPCPIFIMLPDVLTILIGRQPTQLSRWVFGRYRTQRGLFGGDGCPRPTYLRRHYWNCGLLDDGTAFKAPYPGSEIEKNIIDITKEASIYEGIGPHDRLVRMLGHSREGLVLEYMRDGDLLATAEARKTQWG